MKTLITTLLRLTHLLPPSHVEALLYIANNRIHLTLSYDNLRPIIHDLNALIGNAPRLPISEILTLVGYKDLHCANGWSHSEAASLAPMLSSFYEAFSSRTGSNLYISHTLRAFYRTDSSD